MASVDSCWNKFKENVIREIPFFRDKESWWSTLETDFGWNFGDYDVSEKSKCAVMLVFFTYKLLLYKKRIREAMNDDSSESYDKVFSLERLNEITLEIPYSGSRKNPDHNISLEKGEYFIGRYLVEFIEIAVETLINSDPSEPGCYYLYQHNLEVDMTTPTLLSERFSEDRYPLWKKNDETGYWERTEADEPDKRNPLLIPGMYTQLFDNLDAEVYFENFLDDIHETVNEELNRPSNSDLRDMDFKITLHKTLVEDYVHSTSIPDFVIYLKKFIYQMYHMHGTTLDYNNKSYDEIFKMVEIERETRPDGVETYGRQFIDFEEKVKIQLKKRLVKIENEINLDIFTKPENYYHLLTLRQYFDTSSLRVSEFQTPIKLFNLSAISAPVSIKRNETFRKMKYMEGVFKYMHKMYENIINKDYEIQELIDKINDERNSLYKLRSLYQDFENKMIKICIEKTLVIVLRTEAFNEISGLNDDKYQSESYKTTLRYAIALNNVYQYEIYLQLISTLFPSNVKIPDESDNVSILEVHGLNDNNDLFPDPVIYKKIFATFESIIKVLTPSNPYKGPLTTVPFLHPWNHWKVLRDNDPEETFRRNVRAIVNNLTIIERESKHLYDMEVSVQDYQTLKLSEISIVTKKQHIEEKLENIENIYNELLRYLLEVNIFENNIYILEQNNLVSEEDVPQTKDDRVLGDIYFWNPVFYKMYDEGDLRTEMMDEVFDLKNEPIAEREYWKLWPERKSYVENKSRKRADLPTAKYKAESDFREESLNEQYPISKRQKTYLEMIGSLDPVEVFKSKYKDEARKAYMTQTPMGKVISEATSQTRQPLRSTAHIPTRRSKFDLGRYSALDNKRLWEINHYYDKFPLNVLKSFYMVEIGGQSSENVNRINNHLEMINLILKDCCHKQLPFFMGRPQVMLDENVPSFFYGNIEWWTNHLDDEKYPDKVSDIFFYLNENDQLSKNPRKKLLSELINEGLFTLDVSDVSPTDYVRMANWLFPVLVDYIQDSSVYGGYEFIFKLEPLMKLEREKVYIPELDRAPLYTISEGGKSKRKKSLKKKKKSVKKKSMRKKSIKKKLKKNRSKSK